MNKKDNIGTSADFYFEKEPDMTARPRALVSKRAAKMKLRAHRRRTPEQRAASQGYPYYPVHHSHYYRSDKNETHSHHSHSSHHHSDSHSHSSHHHSASHSHSSEHHSSTHSHDGDGKTRNSVKKMADKSAKSVKKESRAALSNGGRYEENYMENEVLQDKPARKKRKGLKVLAIILAVLLFLTAVPVGAFFIMRSRGKKGFEDAVIEEEEVEVEDVVFYDEGKTLSYKGKKYLYNENVVPIAFFGLDKFSLDDDTNMAGVESSQNDLNMVAVFDTETGEVTIIVVPRDSLVDVDVYDDYGDYLGIQPMQLCLAYPSAMGAGEKACCENALLSVERILCGIDINNYVSLDVNSVGAMADAMGGIDLVSIQTIGDFTEGVEYHLTGDLAKEYVQTRDVTTFNSDSMRRQRQIQFIRELGKKVYANILSDFGSVAELYGILNEHTYSTINLEKVTYLASAVVQKNSNFSLDNIIVLEGEPALVNGYMEFYPDPQSVFETVLSVFYVEDGTAE